MGSTYTLVYGKYIHIGLWEVHTHWSMGSTYTLEYIHIGLWDVVDLTTHVIMLMIHVPPCLIHTHTQTSVVMLPHEVT